jgi:peptidoglycan glycosyltransferase
VAVYNYKTGEVLCMVSAPSFDPYDSEEVLKAVNEGDSRYNGVYLNHFISSAFTPGSTFKLVTTAAALDRLSSIEDFSYTCTGSMELNGDTITCPSVHGTQNLAQALANSCNCAYAQLAVSLGADTLEDYAKQAGLLDPVKINGMTSARGSYSVSAIPSDIGWSGVGQYTDLVNPCSELVFMGCIAGEGKAKTPTLLKSVTTDLGLPGAFLSSSESSIGYKPSTCRALKQLMRSNVTEHYGQDRFGDLPVCAKSGTAEVGSDVSPHAWFVGFIDDDTHPYAFVVLVENGGWGSSVAGGVAAEVLEQLCD